MNETEAARHQREIARINAMQYADQAVRDAAIQRENERYEKALASGKKKTRETRNDEATRLLLQYSQQQAQVEGQIAAARQSAGIATEKMTEAHKQLLALQQRISDLDGKKLTADEKSVLARKDELIQALTLLDVKQQELQKQTALNELKKKTIQLTSQLAEEERAQRQQHDLDIATVGNLEATGLYQVPLSAAQPGDVLLCCFGSSVPNHAAIYCGDGELLHHIPEQLSKRERYTDKWQRRTHSLWRHRAWHASAFTGIYNDLVAASTFV